MDAAHASPDKDSQQPSDAQEGGHRRTKGEALTTLTEQSQCRLQLHIAGSDAMIGDKSQIVEEWASARALTVHLGVGTLDLAEYLASIAGVAKVVIIYISSHHGNRSPGTADQFGSIEREIRRSYPEAWSLLLRQPDQESTAEEPIELTGEEGSGQESSQSEVQCTQTSGTR